MPARLDTTGRAGDNDGEGRNATYIGSSVLAFSDATPAQWAPIISWLISLLPPGTPMIAMTDHNQHPVPLPAGRAADRIAAFLHDLGTAG